jgi:hypothetical protein
MHLKGLLIASWIGSFVCAGSGLFTIIKWRKPGLSVFGVLAGGPFLYFQPGNYVRQNRLRSVIRWYMGALAFFVVGFFVAWIPNNLGRG